MFKNGKSKPEKPSSDVTVINRGTTVEGEVKVSGTIRVYGCLNGTIRSEGKVIVAEDGLLKGDIYADAADISGTVEGLIETNRLDLRDTATVEGNVVVKKFTAETGAVFIGDCKMPQNGTLPSGSEAKTSAENTANGETAHDATDESDEQEAPKNAKKAAKGTAADATENGNGVKPLPKKPNDAEPQAEEAGVSNEEDGSTRPRFW